MNNYEDYLNKGINLNNQGNYDEAIETFDKAIELDLKSPVAYYNKGNALFAKGNYDEAIDAFDRAIELEPEFLEVYCNKGSALVKQGHYNEAIDVSNKAIKLNSKSEVAYCNKGIALARQGHYDEAINIFNKTIKLNPKSKGAYYNKGNALARQGHYDEAINAFNKAIELDTNFLRAYVNKGNVLYDQGNYNEAIETFDKAIELDSKSPIPYNNKGTTLYKKGNSDEAYKFLSKAIKLNPNYLDAYQNLGFLLKKSNENLSISIVNLIKILDIINLINYKINVPANLDSNTLLDERELKDLKAYSGIPNFKNNDKASILIINLIIKIHNFKIDLLLDDDYSKKTYYQYTSLKTLKSLLDLSDNKNYNNDANINLRLYNTDYMNDPDEGSTLLSYFGIEKKESNKASHSFIASLTPEKQKDEIPMWRMYGDNNKGVSIGFSGFPLRQYKPTSTNNHSNTDLDRSPSLYKVLYIDDNLIDNPQSQTNPIVSELNDIKKDFNYLKVCGNSKEFEKQVESFFIKELGYARFLVKNRRYEYEHEIRLLQLTESFENAKYDINNIKLFMEYRNFKDIDDLNETLKIDEIIFGIDSDLPNDWSAMIEKKLGENIKLTRTSIHYRS